MTILNYRMWNGFVFCHNHNQKGCPEIIPDQDLYVLDTNDIQKLDKLADDYKDKDKLLRKHVDYRKGVIQKVDEIEKKGPKRRIKRLSEKRDDDFELQGIDGKKQYTNSGCWSVVLSQMLKWEGVDDLNQHEIRAYRGIPSYEGVDQGEYRESRDQNMGYSSNIGCHMNLISKVLPNMAMHRARFYVLNKKLIEDVKEELKKIIIDVVKKQKTPLAIEIKNHYQLIYGLDEDWVRYYDPVDGESSILGIEKFAKRMLEGAASDVYWLSNIKITDGKPDFQIQRKLGSKNDVDGLIKYDEDGKLHDMVRDKDGQLKDMEQYMKGENKDHVEKDRIDPEYAHENYEVFYTGSEHKSYAEIIYLPRKLKLKKNDDESQKKGGEQKQKLLREEKVLELKDKAKLTYEEFSQIKSKKDFSLMPLSYFEGNQIKTFHDACKANFELISLYLNEQILLDDKELSELDSRMVELFDTMKYVRVDDNQSETYTTKFFNAIGWSSNKPQICENMNEEVKKNKQYPVKMFHTIRPAGTNGPTMKEIVNQMVGNGEYGRQFYNSSKAKFGQGLYTAAANLEKISAESEEDAREKSWDFGPDKGSVQFTMALNEHAKVIDNNQLEKKMSEFADKFPATFGFWNDREKVRFRSILAALNGYNVIRVKTPVDGDIDYYCITDRKAITLDSTIQDKVTGYNSKTETPAVIEGKKLDEYLAST